MNIELRGETERLRAALKINNGCPWEHAVYAEGPSTPSSRFQYVTDCEVLARAYLAEHPVEGDEQITDEWLKSVGFSNESINGLTLLIDCLAGKGDPVELYLGERSCADEPFTGCMASLLQSNGDDHVLLTGRVFKTRGDVRRLCAVLGATLR